MATKVASRPPEYRKERYWKDPYLERLYGMINYYRKRRADGKEWIPKPASKLTIYCNANGMDVVAVIEGKQSITNPGITKEMEELRDTIVKCQRARAFILANSWLPPPDSKLAIWCRKHDLDIEAVIIGEQPLEPTESAE